MTSLFQTIASLLATLRVQHNRRAERPLLHTAANLRVPLSVSEGPTGLFYLCSFTGIFVFICNFTKLTTWGRQQIRRCPRAEPWALPGATATEMERDGGGLAPNPMGTDPRPHGATQLLTTSSAKPLPEPRTYGSVRWTL